MFIKAKATDHNTERASRASQSAPGLTCSRAHTSGREDARVQVRVRLEGAPWLSLRDRCGEARPARGADRRARRAGGAQDSSWRSLSRLEVAVVLVLLALLSAVFRGAQSEPMLAFTPPQAAPDAHVMVAPVSLVE